jgi:hypothetical protein
MRLWLKVVSVTHATTPRQPAGTSSRLKRAFTPVQAPDRGMPRIVTPMVAGTSGINTNLLNRLGPIVTPLAARLGPPNTSVAPDQSTLAEEVVVVTEVEACAEPKAKRPRGPDRRPEQYRALTQQGLAALNLPELVRIDVDRPFQAAAHYNCSYGVS